MQASFIKSAAGPEGFPEDLGTEVAVVGRSNSGKSSAINRIVGHGKLARVSKTPGRTQLINFFDLGAGRRLVDLPGYGFARVPERVRNEWRDLVDAYLGARTSLAGLILTVDVRRGLLDSDRTLLAWAAELGLPVLILLTKADKLSRGAGAGQRLAVEREVARAASSGPAAGEGPAAREAPPDGPTAEVILFSAVDGTGIEAARERLEAWLAEPE